ncbi:molybdopterin-dependent oxidoreductase [Candidatus Sororendozoicomonas aggregata]|uniref:molybdopterin-dependent oxidoreductase n=1 Tax=Candidatus Sororendozoicomonas aggregata TaxID=3073239 RepID=UPI002ED34CFA
MNRRNFLQGFLATSAMAAAPVSWVYAANRPGNVPPLDISTLQWKSAGDLPDHYTLLNTNPLNAMPSIEKLNPDITPAGTSFIRWNGNMPDFASIDVDKWQFKVDGESVITAKSYTIDDLKTKFQNHSLHLTLECGGNSRRNFYPKAKGNQWNDGAVYCSKWTGVLVSDVLNDCGVKDDAVYTGHHSFDKHLSGKGEAISRGVPIDAALNDNALIAWAMNDQPIPYLQGYPLRIVFGGRPASISSKCATGISIRNKVHDGHKMESPSYRVPTYPVAPGEMVDPKDFEIIEHMIVKSLITSPASGTEVKLGEPLTINGHAWAGLRDVVKLDISYDYGVRWHSTTLKKPVNPRAWQQWETTLTLPEKGYYEIWAKATDSEGDSQPVVQPQWNPKGYMFNGCHRIAVRVV